MYIHIAVVCAERTALRRLRQGNRLQRAYTCIVYSAFVEAHEMFKIMVPMNVVLILFFSTTKAIKYEYPPAQNVTRFPGTSIRGRGGVQVRRQLPAGVCPRHNTCSSVLKNNNNNNSGSSGTPELTSTYIYL